MNILLSAYACEPNKGSESEISRSWVKYLSKTKPSPLKCRPINNRTAINNDKCTVLDKDCNKDTMIHYTTKFPLGSFFHR